LESGEGDIMSYQANSLGEQQNKIYYFSYTFQEEIYLEKDGKKIPCSLYHFERSYNLSSKRSFMLGFEIPKESRDKESTLVINSNLLNTGPVKFNYLMNDLPKLKL
jgi:hypothetical protein